MRHVSFRFVLSPFLLVLWLGALYGCMAPAGHSVFHRHDHCAAAHKVIRVQAQAKIVSPLYIIPVALVAVFLGLFIFPAGFLWSASVALVLDEHRRYRSFQPNAPPVPV